jgi:hypothetical protein
MAKYFADVQRLDLGAATASTASTASAPLKWSKAPVKSKKPAPRSGHSCVAFGNQVI